MYSARTLGKTMENFDEEWLEEFDASGLNRDINTRFK
jgi:hypothetical protein